jgi:hypothetical protein
MKELILIFVAVVIVLALCLGGLSIRILLKRNGEFKRQCASCDPYTRQRYGCVCGKDTIDKPCKNDKKHSVLEINKELLDELK